MSLKVGPIRDVALLLVGLAILIHETVIAAEPREVLLLVVAAMLGIPATLRTDRLFQKGTPATDETPSESSETPTRE
jgi:hypothetical protein